ncbi:MAG: hypothetical protein J5I98_06550 [Phaeodactylibacter sp.]|nr:hypothetical protein [Phaeodactylibacter sp.]
MSKGILDHPGEDNQASVNLVGRVVLFAGILLGAVNFGVDYGLSVLNVSPNLMRQAALGAFLFLTWLAVSSGLRSVDKLQPGIAVGWLFITGMGIGLWGQVVFALARWAKAVVREEGISFAFFLLPGLLPSLSVSLLVAVLTAITLRVESKLLATLLRILIFGLIALFIYLWL